MTWRELEKAIAGLPDSVLDQPATASLGGGTPPPPGVTFQVTGLDTSGPMPVLLLAAAGTTGTASAETRPTPRSAQPAARR
jgi:hypothetical protein